MSGPLQSLDGVAAATIEKLMGELAEARDKNSVLHRRCQQAEAAVREKLRTSNGPHDSRGLYVRMLGCAAVLAEEDTEQLRAMVVRLADAIIANSWTAELVAEARALHVATGTNPVERSGEAQALGRANERADVVAWLREPARPVDLPPKLADGIEAWEHRNAAVKAERAKEVRNG